MKLKPDGLFLSNGPGDPFALTDIIQNIKALLETNLPIFGICLGFQLLCLAMGAETKKMKFGHHGANHPVINLETNKVLITSQNHGFMVQESSLPTEVTITHRSLFDDSLQGIRLGNVFGFQGHPEASPGPHDLISIFDEFGLAIKNNK
jgi:carbamoyl-phosphate synthase small subunit